MANPRGRSKVRRCGPGVRGPGSRGPSVDSSSPRNGFFAINSGRHRAMGASHGGGRADVHALGRRMDCSGRPDSTRRGGEFGFWQVGESAAIAVHEGCAVARVSTPAPGSEVLVVVSATGAITRSVPDSAHGSPCCQHSCPELANDGPRHPPVRLGAVVPVAGMIEIRTAPTTSCPRTRVSHAGARW